MVCVLCINQKYSINAYLRKNLIKLATNVSLAARGTELEGEGSGMVVAGAPAGDDETMKDVVEDLEALAEEGNEVIMGCHNCGYPTTVSFCTCGVRGSSSAGA